MKHLRFLSLLAATSLLSGCGCDAIGYSAAEVSLQDGVTGRPVPLGGATVSYDAGEPPLHEQTYPADFSEAGFSVCCGPGQWAIHVAKPGYAPFDTSVRVRSRGRCEQPVLVRLLARLKPLQPGPAARSAVPAV